MKTIIKYFWIITGIVILIGGTNISCSNQKQEPKTSKTLPQTDPKPKKIIQAAIQPILDSANLKGAVLVYYPEENIYFSNDFRWAKKGQLPASTFKIPNSIVALETGVIKDLEMEIKWDGEPRHFKIWEKDMTFKEAFRASCLPCYQEIAKEVGTDRMNEWLLRLKYGSPFKAETSNLDLFWVAGDWEVTLFDQIDFLSRLFHSELPISKRTEKIVKEIMINEQNEQFILRGKTGWSFEEEENNGWFVGYLEKEGQVFFFATNVEPNKKFDMKDFPSIRKKVTMEVFEALDLL